LNQIDDSNERSPLPRKRSAFELLVATSPLVAMAAILWRLFAMKNSWFDVGEAPVFLVALAAIGTGVIGGLYCLALHRNRWWLWLALFSMILGYVELQMVFAIAMSHMH
jgi:hypothetical protein